MAPRRGADVVDDQTSAGLAFNEPLSWRAGKPIATGELLKRLDSLSSELREMDQEETDVGSLTKVAKELAGQHLLGHKDKGVRAFTACCLVDILKLCAPDAPFTPTQLKDIFTLFITSILPALSDPSNAYNTQHKYVLISLSEVKSIILLMDIPNSEALILHLFSSVFDIISGSSKASTGEQISKDVEYHMSQMLVTLVDEAASLPTQVVDIIVAQFLRATSIGATKGKSESDDKQPTLLLKELPEAYNLARTICNSCPEKMARYISQYFNDVILEISTASGPANGHRRKSDVADSDEDETHAGPTEADLRELQKAHRLLRELWRASPSVLQNVIPQLEAELSADSIQLRLLGTETLGDIISGIGAAGPPPPPQMDPAAYPPAKLELYATTSPIQNILTTPSSPQSFPQTHPAVYHSFLGRRNDKSAVIRAGWTTAIGRILVTSAGGIGLSREEEAALIRGLGEKLNDADEKVRLAAVRSLGGFGFRDVMTKLAPNGPITKSGSLLSIIADRARDRKHAVRVEAMTILGRLWGVAAGEIAAGNETVNSALGSIPSRIFDAYYANDLELNALLDHVTFEQLIPLSYPPVKGKAKATNGDSQSQTNGDGPIDPDKIRTERILLLVKSLDAKSKKAFFAMQARQSNFANILSMFLKRCEEYNGGVVEGNAKEAKEKLLAVVKYLADMLPDPPRSNSELQKFAKMHDRRCYQLLRFAMAPESDFKTVYKAIKEFSKRVESAPGAPVGLLETLLPLIYRSASLIYNRNHLPVIMKYRETDEKGLGSAAQEVMREISEKNPQVFKVGVGELTKDLVGDAPSKTSGNRPSSVETLKACAAFAKASPEDIPRHRTFVQTLINFTLYGVPPKAAKYAVKILMTATDKKEMHARDLLDQTIKGWSYGGAHFLTKLVAISQLVLLGSKIVDEYSDEIINITTHQLLFEVRTPKSKEDSLWQADDSLDDECQAKCWALKILVNRLRGIEDAETAKKLAVPVFKLLNALIHKKGEIAKKGETPQHHGARLRLLAAQLLLKLCRHQSFDDLLSPVHFNSLALVAQDPLSHVRRGFVEKLQKYLVRDRLPNRFYTVIFITAFEPDMEFRNSIVTWTRSRAKFFQLRKSHVMESTFPRLVSLLAHHPDYSPQAEDLIDHGRYILYYLSSVSSEDNLALIYKYTERVKQARDAIPNSDPGAIYVLSDMALTLEKKWEEKNGWQMQTWPTKVGLPIGLFGALPTHEAAQDIAEKDYLPEGFEESLDHLVKDWDKKKVFFAPDTTKKAKQCQKRKASAAKDDESQPVAKKARSESKPAKATKEKPSKEKKTPARAKRPKHDDSTSPRSTPAANSVDRRRSGRGASARKSYADRDDSEDDEEMWEGVAEWEYLDAAGGKQAAAADDDEKSESSELSDEDNELTKLEDNERDDVQMGNVAPTSDATVAGDKPAEDDPSESTPTPPRSNGKKALPTRTNTRRSAAMSSSPAPATLPPASKATRANVKPKVTAASPIVRTKRGVAPISKTTVKGKENVKDKGKVAARGRTRAAAKDAFDLDDSS